MADSTPTAGPGRALTLAFASVFGLGYLPRAPGTFGTLAALPVWYLASLGPLWLLPAIALLVSVVAVPIASRAEAYYGDHDVQHIVIDEVAGMLVTAVGVPFAWPEVVAAFLVFRVLDVTKPPPIRTLDERVAGGLGVVIDDVAAGVVGCLLLHGARLAYGGWW